VAKESLQGPLTGLPFLQQHLDGLQQGLQLGKVDLSHTMLPVKMWKRAATCKCQERRISLILQQGLGPLPPQWRIGLRDREVGVRPGAGVNQVVHSTQRRRSRTRIRP
jgi:hypothetical protein